MVSRILIIASIACGFNLTSGATVPAFITPCKIADSECAKENAIRGVEHFAKGIPELGVEVLDPVFFKKVDSSSPNLKFILNDVTLTGLKSCKPLIVKRDTEKPSILIKLSCALKLDGNYELDGNVLILDIVGKGKIHVFLRNMETDINLDYAFKDGKDGKKYLRIKKFTHSFELKEKSDVVFDGLFQDNDVLRQAADNLFKNSGNEVIREIGGEMIQASLTRVVENFNHFFAKVPYDEVSLD